MYPEFYTQHEYAATSLYMLAGATMMMAGSLVTGNPLRRFVDAAMPYILSITPMAALVFILAVIS